jgi:hypothetical protein
VTGSVNFSNDALTYQVVILFLSLITVNFLYYSDELMAQNALKGHIAAGDFQVGIADTCQQDADKGFAFFWKRLLIALLKPQDVVLIDKGAHGKPLITRAMLMWGV